jgi:hypothetical protein
MALHRTRRLFRPPATAAATTAKAIASVADGTLVGAVGDRADGDAADASSEATPAGAVGRPATDEMGGEDIGASLT